MTSKEELLYLARLSEQSERYDEMVVYATQFSKESKSELSVEERNILSVAYKNVVGQRRAAWRVLHSIQQKESRKANETNVQRVITYKQIIEKELRDFCYEVLKLLDTTLIALGEAKVFYRKMKGDYYRYICEFATEKEKETSQQEALKAYQQAYEIAQNELTPTHPVRLGLTLNFSVFYYETMEDTEKAIEMAKTAFDEAIAELDHVTEESYKDSTLIMQLLRDNLTLWTSDLNEDQQ